MKQLLLALVMVTTMLAGPGVASGHTLLDRCRVNEIVETTRSGRTLARCDDHGDHYYIVVDRKGAATLLRDPWGYTYWAVDINERGVVVGASSDEDDGTRGLVWIPPTYDAQVLEPLSPSHLDPNADVTSSYSVAYSIDNRQRIMGRIQVLPEYQSGVRDATWKVRGKSVVLLSVEDD